MYMIQISRPFSDCAILDGNAGQLLRVTPLLSIVRNRFVALCAKRPHVLFFLLRVKSKLRIVSAADLFGERLDGGLKRWFFPEKV